MTLTKVSGKKKGVDEQGPKILDRNSPVPLYHQLAEHFEEKIRSGKYIPNQKMPTISELIHSLDVSLPVVQQAMGRLEELGLISRERGRGTFVRPGAGKAGLETRVIKHRRLGILMSWNAPASIFLPLPSAVEDVSHQQGFQVVIADSRDDAKVEIDKARELINHGIDGLLWMCPSRGPNPALVRRLLEAVPVIVAIDRKVDVPGVRMNLVEPDNTGGMTRLMEHLIGRGYRKIAYVSEPFPVSSTFERATAYRQTLRQAGIEPKKEWEFSSRKYIYENGIACGQEILRSGIKFDAVCCQTDGAAIGVLNVLQEKGIRIPQDIALAGFNDETITTMVRPKLTTVRIDMAQIGRQATQLLLNQLNAIDQGKKVEPTQIAVPVELVVRESA